MRVFIPRLPKGDPDNLPRPLERKVKQVVEFALRKLAEHEPKLVEYRFVLVSELERSEVRLA